MPYDYTPAESISQEEFVQVLTRLDHLLNHLPSQLPTPKSPVESRYGIFLCFELDSEILEKTGDEVATLGEQLECIFGWNARTTGDGILPILERGPSICAAHPLLEGFYKKYPKNNVLKKWVIDLAIGAEKAYEIHGVPIPTETDMQAARKRALSVQSTEEAVPKKARASESKSIYQPNSSLGRTPNDVMSRLVIKYIGDNNKRSWGCVASKCDYQAKGNAALDRVLKHATKCKVLAAYDPELYQMAIEESVSGSLGVRLSKCQNTEGEAAGTAEASGHQGTAQKKPAQSNQLDLTQLRKAGGKRKEEEMKHFQLKVDHVIMRLICIRGLIPNVIDSAEWKELMTTLNSRYKPTSADVFADSYIPREAVHVRNQQIELLRKERNLTLTFDGTTTRKPQSFYTAHATTPLRQTYFLDGHEGSDERHTTSWCKDKLTKTMNMVGPCHWGAVCSDSTNVTKAARREIAAAIPTVIDLCDCVHHLQNTIKDITKLSEFKFFISILKAIIKHFSKSTYSAALLLKERNVAGEDEPVKALQKIGKTRFGTHWMASTALDPCLPSIRKLVIEKEVKFKNTRVQGMFINRASGKYNDFEASMLRYNTIVGPFIRSLWSLEAAHANASDVMVFWVAIAATLNDLFKQGPAVTGIPLSLANNVTAIFNKRYAEFFTNDVYFTAFALDPRYPLDDFLEPPVSTTSVPMIVIPALDTRTGTRLTQTYPQAYEKVKEYLKKVLRGMFEQMKKHPEEANGEPVLMKLGEAGAARELKHQLLAYWRWEWPFKTEESAAAVPDNPLTWWQGFEQHPHARVLALLAIKLFSILVNSMPDERTNSTITWFNSPLRGNQTAQTLVDMIQVGQWYGKHQSENPPKERQRPTVKFRKINNKVLEAIRTKTIVHENEDDESSSDEDGDGEEDGEVSRNDVERLEFEIDDCINLDARALIDMISEKPITDDQDTTRPKDSQPPVTVMQDVDEDVWNF
ncbi:hypothetical protein Hypma_001371 [Hypsizygus marmoreus]|uniref:Uncharacterized protein n=1 Tax=Hypsizygus marmoreus TaxID=39966 RepID=A0A369K8U2_HYPMA|nr:hypothetical protein Hypma_001371 [Hypsizygus marmoreus]